MTLITPGNSFSPHSTTAARHSVRSSQFWDSQTSGRYCWLRGIATAITDGVVHRRSMRGALQAEQVLWMDFNSRLDELSWHLVRTNQGLVLSIDRGSLRFFGYYFPDGDNMMLSFRSERDLAHLE